MYNQNEMCESPRAAGNSPRGGATLATSSARLVVYTKPQPAWRSFFRFLCQAAFGGMIGSYVFAIALALYYYKNREIILLMIFLPFYLAGGAIMGLVTG